jgi:hypothetical protein
MSNIKNQYNILDELILVFFCQFCYVAKLMAMINKKI